MTIMKRTEAIEQVAHLLATLQTVDMEYVHMDQVPTPYPAYPVDRLTYTYRPTFQRRDFSIVLEAGKAPVQLTGAKGQPLDLPYQSGMVYEGNERRPAVIYRIFRVSLNRSTVYHLEIEDNSTYSHGIPLWVRLVAKGAS